MAAHLAGQQRAGLFDFLFDVRVAGLAHDRLAAQALNFLEENVASLHVSDDGSAWMALQNVFGEYAEQLIAPNYPACGINRSDSVAIAVEGYANIALFLFYRGDQLLQVLWY